MKPIDMRVTDYNCEYLGLSRLCLMESAGKSLAEEVAKIAIFNFSKPVKVVMFTGSGGNGGDCFVAARYLLNRGYDVDICMLKDNIHSNDAKTNLEILNNMMPRLSRLSIYNQKSLNNLSFDDDAIIVDGILGTGIKGKLQDGIKKAVELINRAKGIKISVDVPSGMDPLTGDVADTAVIPDYTICFHKIKTGVRWAGEDKVGGLVTADIGIPMEAEYFINYGDFLRLNQRKSTSHKGENGKLLIVGASKDYHGAPAISGMAAIKSGVDLVHIAAPESATIPIKSASPDLIVHSLEGDNLSLKHAEEILKLADNVECVLIGPGSGICEDTSKLFNTLVLKIKKPIVLDADALKQVDINLVKNRKNIILTPHIKEFGEFFNVKPEKLDLKSNDFEKISKIITQYHEITRSIKGSVIVKSEYDLVLCESKFKINRTGNPSMTVGGTGDALAGIAAGLLTQGLDTFDAAALAVFINGLSGDRAYEKSGNGFSASDMVSYIGEVIHDGLCKGNI